PTSPIVLLLALLIVLASGEAFAFSPGNILTTQYFRGIVGVDPTDGSQTLIVGYDFYLYRGLVIAPNGDFPVIDSRSAHSAQLIRINGGTETVVTPGGLITAPLAMARA